MHRYFVISILYLLVLIVEFFYILLFYHEQRFFISVGFIFLCLRYLIINYFYISMVFKMSGVVFNFILLKVSFVFFLIVVFLFANTGASNIVHKDFYFLKQYLFEDSIFITVFKIFFIDFISLLLAFIFIYFIVFPIKLLLILSKRILEIWSEKTNR